jgi:hypothetical protein
VRNEENGGEDSDGRWRGNGLNMLGEHEDHVGVG